MPDKILVKISKEEGFDFFELFIEFILKILARGAGISEKVAK